MTESTRPTDNHDLHRAPDGTSLRTGATTGGTFPASIDPTDEAYATHITTRPGWVHLDTFGIHVDVYRDEDTGAPVVAVDTEHLPETDAGPVMLLTLNDHDYLDNADGKGAPMTPAAILTRAIATVRDALGEHDEGTFLTLLMDADVLHTCGVCGMALDPEEQTRPCDTCGSTAHLPDGPAETTVDDDDWDEDREIVAAGVAATLVLQRWEGDQAVEVARRELVIGSEWLALQDRHLLTLAADHPAERDWIVEAFDPAAAAAGPYELELETYANESNALHQWLRVTA